MKTTILGTVAGLILGMIGALAYSHIAAEQQLSDLQAQLDAANAKLAKTSQDRQQLASETSSVSDQIDQLQASNDDLKKQLSEAKAAAPETMVAPAAEVNPLTLGEMMRGMMRGGFQGTNQRLFLLQSRLHLSPDQANAIKAAMQADARTRGEMMRQMFGRGGRGGGPGGQGGQGGPGGPGGPGGGGPGGGGPTGTVDPALAAKANTLDQTLTTVLTPQQRAAYQQVQTEEQAARADTQATSQMNQMAPLLQLTDAQKDQMVQQLYQIQMQAPDPGSLMTNPNATTLLTQQAQATQQMLSKVLSPQQLDIYQQAGQAVTQNRTGGQGRNGAAATAATTAANGGTTAAGATTASVAGTNAASSTTATDSTNSASTTTSSTTNAASSTTDNSSAATSTNAASSGDTNAATTNATQPASPQ